MKILHLAKKYPDAMGGDAIVVANLEKQQSQAGHQVVIMTSNCDDIMDAPQVYKFGFKDTPASLDNITIKRLFSLVMLFFTAFRILKTERPDVIHSHSVDMAFIMSFAARRYKIPLVHTFHIVTFNDPQQSALRRKTELFFLRHARPKRVLVLNPADIPDFAKQGFRNVQFVPNGVNLEDWETPKNIPKQSKFTFIAIGRLEEQKGFMYLIQAAAKLRQQGSDFQVQIAGDGSLRNTLEQQVQELGLQDTVQVLGRKSPAELKELYATAHVFVLPSLWEAFPLTLLEACAARLAVITTAVGFCSLPPKDLAFVIIPPKDTDALAAEMGKLLQDPGHIQSLAAACYHAAKASYTWRIVSAKVTAIYQEAIT